MKMKSLMIVPLFACLLLSCDYIDYNGYLSTLNSLLEKSYDSFSIEVVTQKDDLELTSTYSLSKTDSGYQVNYSIQRYNTFDETSAGLNEMITTTTGTTTIANKDASFRKFTINTNNTNEFNYSKINNSYFEGTISNAKNYLDVDYNCNNFQIRIDYTDQVDKINYQYLLDDTTQCTVTYLIS